MSDLQLFAQLLHILAHYLERPALTSAHLRMVKTSRLTDLNQALVPSQAGGPDARAQGTRFSWCNLVAHCADYVQTAATKGDATMTVYVDNERIEWRGKLWCHLVADSLDELHEFAVVLGLRRHWFQGKALYPHYDVTTVVRDRALQIGASHGSKAQIIASAKRLRAELRTGQTSQFRGGFLLQRAA